MAAAPTLIVGLGGTGSKIVQKVYALATPAQRKNLSFVVFDTDINELRGITEATPSIRTVQTSAKLSVGEYLDADRFARDTWFPVNKIMNRKALTEGAGQVRAISRLAINTTIQQGRMTPLEDAIKELYIMSGDRGNQALRVMLVGSLCGGTGSGCLLPVALYIRNYLKTKLQQGSAVIRGFFLLPEVFEEVIKSDAERANQACNAYAAIREIDAFFMKGDGSLPETYDLHYMVPRPGSKEQDDIADSPMDFCFLYDAQNADGQKLLSFGDYLDHSAYCIYAQSIAPTSKRSNSSEDNVIGEVVREGGRNRYCGAGSSIVEYPLEDVERYLTLIWARDNISTEWLEADREFKKKQKEYLQRKREGIPSTPVDRIQQYITTVDEGYKQKPFLTGVSDMCYKFKPNGLVREFNYWDTYNSSLSTYIDERIEEIKKERDVKDAIDDCDATRAAAENVSLTDDSDISQALDSWFTSLQDYKEVTVQYSNSLGERLAYNFFRDESDFVSTDQDCRLEFWLSQMGKEMMHPNAMRYFLSQVLLIFRRQEAALNGKSMKSEISGDTDGGVGETKDGVEEYWSEFKKQVFDDTSTKRTKEDDPYAFYQRTHLNESEKFKKWIHHKDIKAAKNKFTIALRTYQSYTDSYWEINVKKKVYEAGIKYIESMLQSFDAFYDVLERKVSSLAKDIDELETKYSFGDEERDGMSIRYVCADKACLHALSDEVINLGSSLDIPSELSKIIYNKVRKYALATEKPKTERYFSDTYEDSILGFYKKSILDNYESTVCMDVLSAIGYEAKVTKYKDEEMTDADRDNYMVRVLEAAKHRARPFISTPNASQDRTVDACTYSTLLTESDEPGRKRFVSKQLGDFGGVADKDIDPNRIVFFRAVYALKASELEKFAPPHISETSQKITGGSYFNAYFDRISKLHPDPRKSHAITPHIDRWWHVISKLPDLDDGYQMKQQKDINAAFFWGIISDAISYEPVDKKNYYYRVNVDSFKEFTSEDADLIVSNGTPCDTLYELLDAMMIYPNLVKVILEDASRHALNDLNGQKTFDESYLVDRLGKFRVSQFPLKAQKVGKEGEVVEGIRSILEIPLLMKRSIPTEIYHEEFVMGILNTELDEIKNYMHRFCDATSFQERYEKLLDDQYKLFSKNVAEEDKAIGNIIRSNVYTRICNVVAKEYEEIYQEEKAAKIREMLKNRNEK